MNNKTYFARKSEINRDWYIVDARDQILGRLATKIAIVLMGKNKPTYTPHIDTGDFVIVINATDFALSGKKSGAKTYRFYSGYPGGYREEGLKSILKRRPKYALRQAVRRMLPKTRLGRAMLKKLKIFAENEHPHQAQQPKVLELDKI